MKKKIIWEKWKDPLLSNYDETEWPGFDENEDGEKIPIHTADKQPVLHTPFGVVSLLGPTMASSHFDFWMMHTNFDITEDFARLLENISGVETLEIYTRYRARIGFPRSGLFDINSVKSTICRIVKEADRFLQDGELEDIEEETANRIKDMRDNIDDKYDYWAILMLPNGNVEILKSDTCDEEYRAKLFDFLATKESVGGKLLTHDYDLLSGIK